MSIYFWRTHEPYGEFSNFARGFPLYIDGQAWLTSEHYYQAKKFAGTLREQLVRESASPRDAADLGRDSNHPARADWNQVKETIMFTALWAKFTQHSNLRELLLSTNKEQLIERSPLDAYWGDGADGKGMNRLGVLLMTMRDVLRVIR